MENIKEFFTTHKRILLDGACGTEVQRRGLPTPLPLWSTQALLDNPEAIKQIHKDYIAAGAQIITTNTLRTTKRALAKAGLGEKAGELTQLAVRLAREAIIETKPDKTVLVAGSIAPLEDCYQPELAPTFATAYAEHQEQAENFKNSGVDFIGLETFNTISEARAALQAVKDVGFEATVSFVCGADGKILSGETLSEAVRVLKPLEPLAFFINCLPLAQTLKPLRELRRATNLPVGIYANGQGHPHDDQGWYFEDNIDPEEYANYAQQWLNLGANLIGGCCGTTPEYIEKLKCHLST